MVFSDLFFLFVFLPSVACCYLLAYFADIQWLSKGQLKKSFTLRNAVLVLFSLLFYAWGEPVYVLLMLICVALTYLCGRLMAWKPTTHQLGLVLGLIVNIGILSIFKYTGMLVETLNQLGLHVPDPKISLPIGISFYVFQSISYLVDVYRGDNPVQKNFGRLLLYISMFPQLIAGPIVRYGRVAEELEDRHVTQQDLAEGIQRFLMGLGKKVILANQFSELAGQFMHATVGNDPTVAGAWMGVIAFSLQIYFDFSGYSDMAIGIGRCLGFHFNENFNHPYICTSITDFWRRWHISLCSFFRDYVYIPLGGNRRHQVLNICVVWFLTGLWHGADWTFAMWGIYFALVVLFEKYFYLKKIQPHLWRPLQHVYALMIVIIGRVLFYFDDLDQVFAFYKVLFGGAIGCDFIAESGWWNNFWLWIIGIVLCLPVGEWLSKLNTRVFGKVPVLAVSAETIFKIAFGIMVIVLSVALLVGATNNAFIYTRF